jgi:predicted CopG family antitoxin
MIRNINISVTDEEYEQLAERKGSKTWREFILEIF